VEPEKLELCTAPVSRGRIKQVVVCRSQCELGKVAIVPASTGNAGPEGVVALVISNGGCLGLQQFGDAIDFATGSQQVM
ncbi:MAG: hypothetical protein R3276_13185, partial [Marinobacter sp.]|nr:hypothetical protein [Marinobacter sp.]